MKNPFSLQQTFSAIGGFKVLMMQCKAFGASGMVRSLIDIYCQISISNLAPLCKYLVGFDALNFVAAGIISELQAFLQNIFFYGSDMTNALNSTLVCGQLISTVTNVILATVQATDMAANADHQPIWKQFTKSVQTLDMFGLPAAECPTCQLKAVVMGRPNGRRFHCRKCGARTEFFQPGVENVVAGFNNHYIWDFPHTRRTWTWNARPNTNKGPEETIVALDS
jgi:hypothetical protein